ncbi:hypothetical protein COCC4DRAFT_154065 [Bipolaris maydis ATCC 48331]|uniref:Uncharacterized protein n=2 Tax=Cochliobolus heterostrophus TaxID=5016 RepID=M2TSC8_COCH5|nr:uncharacterized protein COCC4DRAFT_154065 [Bipolaris maydis ATCC 48331]EMD89419.1 hypothetical protein COCHEDRAFT_1107695 [Bipolaris maydis C5]ENH99129.1 hypothetical protein COCC4DRAFT_154065 [Bipolaris maydis ATCC 48331]
MGCDTRRQYSSSHQCFCILPSRGHLLQPLYGWPALHAVVTIAVLPVAPLLHDSQRLCPIVRPGGLRTTHVGRPPAKVVLRTKTTRAITIPMTINAS